jgi:hypothetical protein
MTRQWRELFGKHLQGKREPGEDTTPAIKKGSAKSALPFDLKMKSALTSKFSPDSRNSDQTKAKKKHGGGFGNRGSHGD